MGFAAVDRDIEPQLQGLVNDIVFENMSERAEAD